MKLNVTPWSKRLTALLLVLFMLVSMIPMTALAAGNYPDHVRVFNASGDTTSLSDKQYLAANDATASDGYDGTQTYVARYDQSSGTLYLNGYHGVASSEGKIYASGDLNIKVENDSSFTTSLSSASGDLYGIQAAEHLRLRHADCDCEW